MNCVVCFGDCLKFPKCIIFCVHWLPGFQTPTLTVANKPHIYYLKQIIRQWIVWSALVTASSYLLSVFIHSFILKTYIAPLQETTTLRRSQPRTKKKDLREM